MTAEALRRLERAFLVGVVVGWRRSLDFSGRSGRGATLALLLSVALGTAYAGALDGALGDPGVAEGFLAVAAVPALAALWRRLHDTGRTGWVLMPALAPLGVILLGPALAGVPFAGMPPLVVGFAPFLALVGVVSLAIWLVEPGEAGANRFGPPPRAGA
jgi:uncharacterized membrane protein YhaH (DUF805 family)